MNPGFPTDSTARWPDRVPAEARHQACLGSDCVEPFHGEESKRLAPLPAEPDYYFDASGLMVFTAAYLRRLGYCCGNGCRHCPFEGISPK